MFILSFQTVDRRETFVLSAQLGDDLGVATLDDPPEPCRVFGHQRMARDRLVVDPQRLVGQNRRAANFVRPSRHRCEEPARAGLSASGGCPDGGRGLG